jgi:hypothetical protein
LGRCHENRLARRAVDEYGEVHLAGAAEVHALLDEEATDHPALGPGLMGLQGHAQHRLRDAVTLLGRPSQLDPAPLAPTPGVDLSLDHNRETKLLRDL